MGCSRCQAPGLLSIDPAYGPGAPVIEPQFMGFNVLGVAVLKGSEKAALIESFKKGIDTKSDTMEAGCFAPFGQPLTDLARLGTLSLYSGPS